MFHCFYYLFIFIFSIFCFIFCWAQLPLDNMPLRYMRQIMPTTLHQQFYTLLIVFLKIMVNFNARFSLGWLPIMLHQIIRGGRGGVWYGDDIVFCIHAQKGVRTSIVEGKIAKDVITNKDRPLMVICQGIYIHLIVWCQKNFKLRGLWTSKGHELKELPFWKSWPFFVNFGWGLHRGVVGFFEGESL